MATSAPTLAPVYLVLSLHNSMYVEFEQGRLTTFDRAEAEAWIAKAARISDMFVIHTVE